MTVAETVLCAIMDGLLARFDRRRPSLPWPFGDPVETPLGTYTPARNPVVESNVDLFCGHYGPDGPLSYDECPRHSAAKFRDVYNDGAMSSADVAKLVKLSVAAVERHVINGHPDKWLASKINSARRRQEVTR